MKRLTIKEVSAELKKNGIEVGDRSIINWCRKGLLTGAVKIGKSWYVTPESVNLLLNPQ